MKQTPTTNFLIFADDSVVGNIAAYGVIGVVPGLLAETIDSFYSQKVRFGVEETEILHCKEIFNPEARKKSAWAHLGDRDVIELCRSIASSLSKTIKPLTSIGFVSLRHMPPGLNLKVPLTSLSPANLPFEKDKKKQALALALPAALRPFDLNLAQIPVEECLVTLGHDATKIAWLNSKKRQAHHAATAWVSGFQIQIGQRGPMLELADMVAYLGAHFVSRSSRFEDAQKVLHWLPPRIWKSSFTPVFFDKQAINYPPNRRLVGIVEDVTKEFPLPTIET